MSSRELRRVLDEGIFKVPEVEYRSMALHVAQTDTFPRRELQIRGWSFLADPREAQRPYGTSGGRQNNLDRL